MSMAEDCIFCKVVSKEIDAEIVAEGNNFIAFRDTNPLTEGHILIVPKKHLVTLLDIPNHLGSEMLELMKKVGGDILDKKLGGGFNILMNNLEVAGQEVMHAHIHVIPRKEGDDIKLMRK